MNTAHTFQHTYTGVQLCVFHKATKELAKLEFAKIVANVNEWAYIGLKVLSTIQ